MCFRPEKQKIQAVTKKKKNKIIEAWGEGRGKEGVRQEENNSKTGKR